LIARSLPAPWLHFVAWCRARGLKPLPAHPWTLAAYARWCEPRQRFPTILGRVRAIARVHLLKCATSPDRHPTVLRTLALIEARDRARGLHADLFQPDPHPGEAPADLARTAKTKTARNAGRSDGRGLRLTPPLVSRRQP
jgi:hypothetical protein